MILQYVIVIAVILAAIGWALWLIIKAFRHSSDPCYGCAGCELKELHKGKNCEKKDDKVKYIR